MQTSNFLMPGRFSHMPAKQAAQQADITPRRIRVLAAQGRIPGAFRHPVNGWQIPHGWRVTKGKRGPAHRFS